MKKLTWLDRIMAAVTFAEANEQDTAKEILTSTERKSEKRHTCRECGAFHSTDLHSAEARS